MLRMIYTSEGNLDPGEMLDEVRRIHRVSVENNQRSGLTGALLFSDMYFLQALEGEASAVHETVARIMADDRHRNVAVMAQEDVGERLFGRWTMKLVLRKPAGDPVFRDYGIGPVFDPARLAPETALGLLRRLAQQPGTA